MDRIKDLDAIVQHEVADYNNAVAWKAKGYYLADKDNGIYTVIDVPDVDHPTARQPIIVVMARIVDDKVIIDEDTTDRPLYEELMRNGIPREQIILAYAGETLPETT